MNLYLIGCELYLFIELLLNFIILIYFRIEIFSYDFIYKNINIFFKLNKFL